jgi:hypothetical protein
MNIDSLRALPPHPSAYLRLRGEMVMLTPSQHHALNRLRHHLDLLGKVTTCETRRGYHHVTVVAVLNPVAHLLDMDLHIWASSMSRERYLNSPRSHRVRGALSAILRIDESTQDYMVGRYFI